MNEQLYNVSANPHVRDKASTHSIMLDVIIALLPATLFGFWNFGVKAIINTVTPILIAAVVGILTAIITAVGTAAIKLFTEKIKAVKR